MPSEELQRARDSYQRRAWEEAYRSFSLADRNTPLAVGDLEHWATAAYLIGRDLDYYRLLDRAHHAHVREGDQPAAARCAFWLSLMLLLRGEAGQASGWLGRAQRFVEGRDCVESGYLILPVAERHLVEGRGAAALAAATRAADVGERFGDADLTALARHVQGRALIQQGEVQRGIGLLDEVMVAVGAGELSPIVTGLLYCSVIDACEQVFALHRAREWTVALTRWCEQQPEMVTFSEICLVHRATVLQFRGAWEEAIAEAARACRRVSQAGEGKPPAAAFYRQGEVYRLRGEFTAAEQAYRTASRLGLEPHPGLALLRLAQGRTDAALAALRRVLGAPTDPLLRARLLPAYTEIALAAGEVQEAIRASDELGEIAGRYATDVLRAMAADARGAVALAEGDAQAALGALRLAFALWQQNEAPYETARVRLRISLACRQLGDTEAADLELEAARAALERLGAAPDLAHLESLRAREPKGGSHTLTRRELQILRHVAAGETNKVIANALSLSERTIDRHVSNILTKLGVASRAAATAHAYQRKLL